MTKASIIKTIKEQLSDKLFFTNESSWRNLPLEVDVDMNGNMLYIHFIAKVKREKNDLYTAERLYDENAAIYFKQIQMPFVGGLKQFYYVLNTKVFVMTYCFNLIEELNETNLSKIIAAIY